MNQDFARTLSLLRRERKLSQRGAAEALGISQALLSHYENGIREPGLAFVIRACDFYNVSADYLLGRTLDRDGIVVQAPTAGGESKAGERRKATAASKPLVSTLVLLFDLLSRAEDPALLHSASKYLSTALFHLFRPLRMAAGERESRPMPSLSDEGYQAGLGEAELLLARSRYVLELQDHARSGKPLPPMDDEALAQRYPASWPALNEVMEETGRRVAGHLPEEHLGRRRRKEP